MARKLAAVVFSLGCLQAGSVMALGLGELKLESFLNEPLKASVDLLNTGGLHQEEIKIRLATREDFDKLGLDRAYFLTNITFEVIVEDDGRARIEMSSDDAVLEPYLDFIVEARWPSGRLLREYTVLIDPPVFAETATVVSASQRVEEVEGIPAPSKKKAVERVSGTKVDVRKSDLAPGAMPQRDFNAAASSQPLAGSRYMISRDQTLWDIASRARPEGATVNQTMLDIQRLNPDAFINGNINRVKAGYIVYLPTATDISSGDSSAALAEVKEQNAAWRESRDAELYESRGPALRISVADQASATTGRGSEVDAADAAAAGMVDGGGVDDLDITGSEASAGARAQMASMEQQLDTLQRIVGLKDDQIAALQNALQEQQAAGEVSADGLADSAVLDAAELEAEVASLDSELQATMTDTEIEAEATSGDEVAMGEAATDVAPAEEASTEPAAATPAIPEPAPTVSEPDSGGGWMSYLLYLIGAVVLGVFGFLFMRSRRQDDDESAVAERVAPAADAFSNVQLRDQNLEVEVEEPERAIPGDEPTEEDNTSSGSRGYGARKHDEYASDVEASDALAEADIYIAYGRQPQAIDLLSNALGNEPNNPVYRLKLIEIYTEQDNRSAATAQLEQLQALGDADSIAKAESFMAKMGSGGVASVSAPQDSPVESPPSNDPGLSPNPFDISSDTDEPLEAEFSGLEIEGATGADDDGDLDLSDDFKLASNDEADDEELVIAADANALSTKLDLARAYLDMGDDDGARQILDEVVAEGSDELKAEALELLNRVGG